MKYILITNLLLFSACNKKLVSSKTDRDIQFIERKATVMLEGAELSHSIPITTIQVSPDTVLYDKIDPTGRVQVIVKKEKGNLNITAKALPKEEEVTIQDKVITVTNESVFEERENFFDEIKDVLFFGFVVFAGFYLLKFLIPKII